MFLMVPQTRSLLSDMDIFQIKEILSTFEVLCDTREKDTPEFRRRCEALEVPWSRAKLNYGDYAYNITFPDGKKLFDTENPIDPLCAIERKESLTELSGNFTKNRDRFRREFERAEEKGSRIYLICENGSWESVINGRYRTRFNPNAYMASLVAYAVRFNANLIFCKTETVPRMIREVLYRDLKERLEKGAIQWEESLIQQE